LFTPPFKTLKTEPSPVLEMGGEKMYTEEGLLNEIRELMDDDELFKMYERAFREYHYYFDTTNYIVLNVYNFNDHGPIHVLLTTRRALELLRIIKKFGIQTTAHIKS
jgi:metal-dependent HD superfamily phosphatase/phosphodiesterase